MIRIFFALNLILAVSSAYSQEMDFVYDIELHAKIENVSVDINGNIYLVSDKGLIYKYSSMGDSLMAFSPRKNAAISLIEAGSGLRIFVFYQDLQEYILLDRYFRSSPHYSFNPAPIGFAALATISTDNNLWLLDQTDFSLKKYNILTNILEIETPLDLIIDTDNFNISFMKEYQNFLFVSDPQLGLFMFDNIGNYKKKIPVKGIEYFNFSGDRMYYMKDGYLTFMNLYNGALTGIPLPSKGKFNFALVNGDKVYLISDHSLKIYEIIP